ncbi:MAG: DUF6054 family protein [Carnobacterium sp.]|uniref:DUF6054 family protein n=1 Tax=Carnobacterium sp. TaxID=48221 RepID=UPI0033153A12
MKEKQVILNGDSSDVLEYFKQNLTVDNYEQSTTYEFNFEYGKGYLTVFEKYFFRNDSVASLTLHIHPLENAQVEVIIIVSGSESGIFKIDWWIGKSIMKTMDKLIEELR